MQAPQRCAWRHEAGLHCLLIDRCDSSDGSGEQSLTKQQKQCLERVSEEMELRRLWLVRYWVSSSRSNQSHVSAAHGDNGGSH